MAKSWDGYPQSRLIMTESMITHRDIKSFTSTSKTIFSLQKINRRELNNVVSLLAGSCSQLFSQIAL